MDPAHSLKRSELSAFAGDSDCRIGSSCSSIIVVGKSERGSRILRFFVSRSRRDDIVEGGNLLSPWTGVEHFPRTNVRLESRGWAHSA
jgi:hypothetical protein